ncbi:hypothetical protein [Streptomyces sp. NPDC101165]|uniref:hypothetical protein n=1 Tax=Streptomyces sp. NPDC101165 TaxID=3366119 RepID=UPI003825B192
MEASAASGDVRPFLAVEHAVLFETDPDRARTLAREHLHGYLNTPYNLAKFRRLGYTDDDFSRAPRRCRSGACSPRPCCLEGSVGQVRHHDGNIRGRAPRQ